MAKSDSTRQTLGREYYDLLDWGGVCQVALAAIVRNASYSKSIKDVTDPRIRDLRELIQSLNRGLQEVIDRQMRTKVTIEA